MLMKVILTGVVAVVWYVLLAANVAAAGRTAASTELREGISAADARRRTLFLILAWATVLTALAAVALIIIW